MTFIFQTYKIQLQNNLLNTMLLVWRVFYECFADICLTCADIPASIADICLTCADIPAPIADIFPPRADIPAPIADIFPPRADIYFPPRADIPASIADIYFPPRADKMLTQKNKKICFVSLTKTSRLFTFIFLI